MVNLEFGSAPGLHKGAFIKGNSDTATRRHDDTEEKWNTQRREALWWKGYNQPGTETLRPDRDLHAAPHVGHMQEGRKSTKQATPRHATPTPTTALHQPTMTLHQNSRPVVPEQQLPNGLRRKNSCNRSTLHQPRAHNPITA